MNPAKGDIVTTASQTKTFRKFSFGTQVRKSPFSDAALRWGAQGFSVYNHMYIPRDFGDSVQNFRNLVNEAILCDVAVERQVEITGPDAARFTQFLSCRDLSGCEVGQCKYVLITDQDGGIINDPILLKLGENRFWLSIADSDVLLWARGVAACAGMDVIIDEPDVSPLQLQVGLEFDGDVSVGSNDEDRPIMIDGAKVGYVTSAVHSPRLERNIALALVAADHAAIGTRTVILTQEGKRNCEIVPKPFFDPKKAIAARG